MGHTVHIFTWLGFCKKTVSSVTDKCFCCERSYLIEPHPNQMNVHPDFDTTSPRFPLVLPQAVTGADAVLSATVCLLVVYTEHGLRIDTYRGNAKSSRRTHTLYFRMKLCLP